MLNTRLAAAESMTHDVIRDLLGVKLDMSNYAVSSSLSLIDNINRRISHLSAFCFWHILELDRPVSD